jgi:hypothetical protein
MRLVGAVTLVVCWMAALVCGAQTAQVPSRWMQPASQLAGQIADVLGPGQAQITVRNLSTIQAGEIPAIRKLLEQDLKARGVLTGGAESANAIRVTLSESLRERLWVAEISEGNTTHVTMVHLDAAEATAVHATSERVVLRKERISGLIDREVQGIPVVAYAPGTQCSGSYSLPLNGGTQDSGWSVRCRASDDPWPVYQSADASNAPALKAFYNTARDFFTGVVTPNIGVDLPAFYAAGMIPRAAGGAAVLLAGVDGKVQIVENGVMRPVAGARDWGSDFAVVRSGCGAGTQVIVSGSGEAASDSLRAFAIPALDAIPESNGLAMDGTVTALWTAQDGKSAFAVVRSGSGDYEVDRVSASCN